MIKIEITLLSYLHPWFRAASVKVRPTCSDKLLNRDDQKGWYLGRRGREGPSRWWPSRPMSSLYSSGPSSLACIIKPKLFVRSFSKKASKTLDGKPSKGFGDLIEKELRKLNGMVARKNATPMIGFLIRSLYVGAQLTRSRCALVVLFCKRCYDTLHSEGFKGLVLWLKVSHVLIQQAIAGDIVKDLGPLKRRVRRARSGLPKWIPPYQRLLLMRGDVPTVRFWTSLCALYRVLDFPHKLNLETITSPGSINVEVLKHQPDIDSTIGVFWRLHDLKKWQDRWILQRFAPFPIGKSTPLTDVVLNPDPPRWVYLPTKEEFSGKELCSFFGTYQSPWDGTPIDVFDDERGFHDPKHPLIHVYKRLPNRTKSLGKNPISTSLPSILLGALLLYTKFRDVGTFMLYYLTGSFAHSDFKRALEHAYRSSLNYFLVQPGSDPKAFERILKGLTLGRLSFKYEPAGKVRVFAMVDCWTQWLFKPLHDLIQDLCRPIKEDATFDQVGRIEEKISAMKAKGFNKYKAFSYDLSAATDRLPVWLQIQILRPLMGTLQSNNWLSVLTDRDYSLPTSEKARRLIAGDLYYHVDSPDIFLNIKEVLWREGYPVDSNELPRKLSEKGYRLKSGPASVRYAAGQPMGALSSWGMLALTHHIVIQWAAFRAGRLPIRIRWFSDYIVLGDDVVIFDSQVASQYYYIMNDVLGVGIGLAKSISSRNDLTLEFAKKYWVRGVRAFMIPMRDIVVATLTSETMGEFMKKHEYTLQAYLRLRGLGFRSRARVNNPLWSMSQRLRFYLVSQQTSRHFLDWISMKSLTENWDVSRPCINEILLELDRDRANLIRRFRNSRGRPGNPWIWNMTVPAVLDLLPGVSFLDDVIIKQIMPLRNDFVNILDAVDRVPYSLARIEKMTDQNCRDFLQALLEMDEELREGAEVLASLTWFTQVRAEEKPFDTFSTLYKRWVKYNGIVSRHSKPKEVRKREPDIVKPSFKFNSNPNPPIGETYRNRWLYFIPSYPFGLFQDIIIIFFEFRYRKYPRAKLWRGFFSYSYPRSYIDALWVAFAEYVGMIYPILIGILLRRFGASFAITLLVLLYFPWSEDVGSESFPINGSSTRAYTSRLTTLPDHLFDESGDDDNPDSGNWLRKVWVSAVVCVLGLAFGYFIWSFLLGFLPEPAGWDGPIGIPDARSVEVVPRSSFRFASFKELLDWRDSQLLEAVPVTRSPELGHGWSEIWTPDPDLLGSHWA